MKTQSLRVAISSILCVGAALTPTLAAETTLKEVVVTGSRVAESNIEVPTPITTLSGDQILATGVTSIGDVLSDLPALRGTFTTANSTRFIGTAGVNFLDLRGLGTERTLVLVNGRRHVAGTDGSLQVDINTIPADLLERVDVVTGGASSIYGSDAIAGVVNFILKKDFEGLRIKGQTGISSRSDNQSSFVAFTAGRNFLDGDANLAFSFEWAKEDSFQNEDRPTTRVRQQFVQTTSDPTGVSSDGIPDREFFVDVRSLYITEGGVFIPSFQPGITATNPPLANRSRPSNGQPRVFAFAPDGTLAELDYGQRDFRPLSSTSLGGGGTTLRRYGDLTPDTQRSAVNIIGHMDISDSVSLFTEIKHVVTETLSYSSPSFNQTTSASTPPSVGSGALVIQLTNPYLTPQALSVITPLLRTGATSFNLNRNNLDLGVRGEDTDRTTTRIVIGAEGNITDSLEYEMSLNYGRLRVETDILGNRYENRLRLAVDAARAADGSIVCRSRLNNANVVVVTGNADIDNCVPVNVLGEGNVTQAARDYITARSTFDATVEQQVANAYVTYRTSDWFELPGGPIGAALGAEYRKESSSSGYSNDVASGQTFLNAIQALDAEYSVKEAFVDAEFPLLKDLPGIQELKANGSYRVADYDLRNTSTIKAWSSGVQWLPLHDIRLRASLSQSVRTPTLSDLFQPLTQNFATVRDPCDVLYINQGSPNRPANCAAAGVPPGFINTVARAQTIEIRSGGNPGLTEEKSRSWTVGAVLQPRFVEGLTVIVDYYDIEINKVINAVTAQQILDNCYDAPSLNNIYCPLVFRDPATSLFYANGQGPIGGGVLQSTLNYAARVARGIDVEIGYVFELGDIGKFDARFLGTYVKQRDNFPFLAEPNRPDRILEELGDPVRSFNFDLSFTRANVSLTYGLRYLGKQYVDLIENIRSVGGLPPTNPDFSNISYTGSVLYHDLRGEYAVKSDLDVYFGVDNISDKLPPLGFTGTGGGSGIFSNKGRYFYAGIEWKL